ncbi:DUF1624 domain-containing protein [Candidatus Peregrinibacteria bacterium]|nr:DUF1624 domain-containing protein [Candidatus Peregrinibacteria bacterium]
MTNGSRLHWVDALRGCLILMMVVYHFAFDVDYMALGTVDVFTGAWLVFARFIQFGFLSLVGLSLFLSYRHSAYPLFLKRQASRVLMVLGAALLVTVGTWLAVPEAFVRFGILHLVAFSIPIASLLIASIPLTLAGIFLSLAMWIGFPSLHLETSFLIPFGITPPDFYTLDYFPLFPWLAVVLTGTLVGRLLEHWKWLEPSKEPLQSPLLETLGRHSLLIYLLHQPVLIGILWVSIHV